MSLNRREFVKISAMASAAFLLARQKAWAAFAQTQALQKFVSPMRHFGVDIPVFTPNTTRYPNVDYYTIDMREFTDQLHPGLPPTMLWGYGTPGFTTNKHLGGAIIAQRNRPVRVTWQNNLPATHPLPVDFSTITPYNVPPGLEVNRAAPHLHGGLVPWPSDGGPYHWMSSTRGNAPRICGPSVVNWLPENDANGQPVTDSETGLPVLNDDYYYPNDQSARLMWYHDHAVGITRLNASIGLASGYIIQDTDEAILMAQLGIPAGRQVPIVFQDKIFNPDGSLWYPDAYDPQFFALAPGGKQLPSPSLVPEFWGDTILANGTAYPFLQVEPRRYRFRLLNACNTRFLSLSLVYAAGKKFPDNTEPAPSNPGPAMRLIGTEGGFLDGAVSPQGVLFTSSKAPLVLAPAERAEVVIDFSKVKPGQFLILHSDAPVPFPGGTPLADFFPGNNKLAVPPAPGFGPNTRTLLQFQVVGLGTLTGDLNPDPPVKAAWVLPPSPTPAVTVPTPRDLALWETVDEYGRLAQNLGTINAPAAYNDFPTEVCQAGTVETWNIYNLTADTHPIHFHYFNVRVLSRQAFNLKGGLPNLTGQIMPPEPGEMGWKETVRMNPGECTTVLVELPPTTGLAPGEVTIPPSPRLTGLGIDGAEYVWHCHILEHEEHDMMRPLVVQG